MPTRQGVSLAKKGNSCARRNGLLKTTLSPALDSVNLENVFGQINTDRDSLHLTPPHCDSGFDDHLMTLSRPEAARRPPHQGAAARPMAGGAGGGASAAALLPRRVHAALGHRRHRLAEQGEVYGLLFKAASEAMLTIAADPKHLGARIGVTAVLHTWGSALTHHPHVHMIVPGRRALA